MELIMLISHLFNVDLYMLKLCLFFSVPLSLSVVILMGRRSTAHHVLRRAQLLVILLSKLHHAVLSV